MPTFCYKNSASFQGMENQAKNTLKTQNTIKA